MGAAGGEGRGEGSSSSAAPPLCSAPLHTCNPQPPSHPPLPFPYFWQGNSLLLGPYLSYLLRLVCCKDSCQTAGSLGFSF